MLLGRNLCETTFDNLGLGVNFLTRSRLVSPERCHHSKGIYPVEGVSHLKENTRGLELSLLSFLLKRGLGISVMNGVKGQQTSRNNGRNGRGQRLRRRKRTAN